MAKNEAEAEKDKGNAAFAAKRCAIYPICLLLASICLPLGFSHSRGNACMLSCPVLRVLKGMPDWTAGLMIDGLPRKAQEGRKPAAQI